MVKSETCVIEGTRYIYLCDGCGMKVNDEIVLSSIEHGGKYQYYRYNVEIHICPSCLKELLVPVLTDNGFKFYDDGKIIEDGDLDHKLGVGEVRLT